MADMPPPRPPVLTLRSVLIGVLGVCFVCGLAPYNDFAMENTMLIGNFLPIGLLLILLLLVLGVNVPVRKLFPKQALRQGELAVVTLMVLAACAVPSSGLMRYLPGGIVGIYAQAGDRPADFGPAIDAAHVPDWLIPTLTGDTAAQKGYDPVITQFRARSPDGTVPWAAWLRPFLTWGVFVALLWGLIISLSLIVRRQWVENERLSFPLATMYESLIESPPPGKLLNTLFSSPGFWIAAGLVFLLRSINALHAYNADLPFIQTGYDARELFVDAPWKYTVVTFKTADVLFSMIGIAFFMQTKTSFSLWFCFIGWQVLEMILGTAQISFTEGMQHDQTFGAVTVFAGVVIYLGRRHWALVLRHMVGRQKPGDADGAYLPYRLTGWAGVFCFAGMIAWLMLAGMTLLAAVALVTIIVMIFMVVARLLADTGLFFINISTMPLRPFYYPVLVPPTPHFTTPTNFFFAGWLTHIFHDVRENLAAFFQMGVKVADDTIERRDRPRHVAAGLIAAVVLAFGVAYAVSWVSMLKVEYTYAQTVSSRAFTINEYGTDKSVTKNILDPSVALQSRNIPTQQPIANPLLHLGIGGAVVAACSVLRGLVAWWPIHPVAFVVLYSYSMQKIWLSVFIGWVAKVIIVRLGGVSLLKAGRPVFIGLIAGDAFAAAFWLVTNFVLNASGHVYKPLLFLPG
ncbi:MAG: hypothetical protein QM754_13550 [Tepidisphaeraceae bacterium]